MGKAWGGRQSCLILFEHIEFEVLEDPSKKDTSKEDVKENWKGWLALGNEVITTGKKICQLFNEEIKSWKGVIINQEYNGRKRRDVGQNVGRNSHQKVNGSQSMIIDLGGTGEIKGRRSRKGDHLYQDW